MTFIANQGEIEPAVTQVFEDIPPPAYEGESNLRCERKDLATENGRDDRGCIVCCGDSKGTMFRHRVECRTRDEPVQFRQHDLKFLKNSFALRGWLITLCRPHQQIIMKCISHSLQCAAHRRLAQ